MLKASRDKVGNLMQVVEKMQTEQAMMSMHLYAEKRKVTAVRDDISPRCSGRHIFDLEGLD